MGSTETQLRKTGFVDAHRIRFGSPLGWWIGAILNFGLLQVYQVLGTKGETRAERARA
jgi:hypothetical protein